MADDYVPAGRKRMNQDGPGRLKEEPIKMMCALSAPPPLAPPPPHASRTARTQKQTSETRVSPAAPSRSNPVHVFEHGGSEDGDQEDAQSSGMSIPSPGAMLGGLGSKLLGSLFGNADEDDDFDSETRRPPRASHIRRASHS